MNKSTISILSLCMLAACTSSSIKEKINKAGDVAGQTAGEFIEGATQGVQKAFDVDIALPDALKDKGIQFGKATVSSDSIGTDNLLHLYVIFTKDFDGGLMAKVFDSKGKEMGRSTVTLNGKKDAAQFVEFRFDKLTNIDSSSELTIE
ncbi:MAG: hypothetical protein IPO27_19000 [Bacteroidetes bacterium]|nr:hypothetical protein [Bacteroidota bacterium]